MGGCAVEGETLVDEAELCGSELDETVDGGPGMTFVGVDVVELGALCFLESVSLLP